MSYTLKTDFAKTDLKALLEQVALSLVDVKDKVHVNEIRGERILILELRVDPGDLGKIIGKQGHIAQAIRTIMHAASMKTGVKLTVEIIEN
ncbi:MAG: KH domain-containing protein [Clostridiales bacterium]|jgi:predicted RNA-binding protein YlqC (UPF0109 family)|nr:KH domain-containing protein [Clostridiales bacterium]